MSVGGAIVRALRHSEAAAWCQERGITLRDAGDRLTRLSYDGGHPVGIELAVLDKASRILPLGYVLLMTGVEDERAFPGGLLWLVGWDIWSESFERVGWRLIDRLRGVDEPQRSSSLSEAPAQLFGPQEIVDAQAFLLEPMLFQWDGYYVPNSGDFFVRLHHDEGILIVPRDRAIFDQLFARFEEGDWNPKESPSP